MRKLALAGIACAATLLVGTASASAKWSGQLTRDPANPAGNGLVLSITASAPSYGMHLGLNVAGYAVSQVAASTTGPAGYPACTPTPDSGLTNHNPGLDCSFGGAVSQVTITFTTSARYPDNGGALSYDDQDQATNPIPGPAAQDTPCEDIHDPSDICGQCPVITVVPSQLKPAFQGVPYTEQLNGNGGQAPYSFSAGAPLPTALQISPAGLLHGTVTLAPGKYPVNLSMVDARDCSASNQATGVAPTGGLVLLLVVKPAFAVPHSSPHGSAVDLELTAQAPGTFTVQATTTDTGAAAAAAHHKAHKTITYATARLKVKKAGRAHLRVLPGKAGLKLLTQHRRVHLQLKVTFKPSHGKSSTKTLRATVTSRP